VPLTSKTAQVYPGQALVMIDGRQSKAMADQIGTVSKLRLRGYLGALDPVELAGVERAIRTQLAL
jgi:mRNA interferase MazF